MLQRSQQNTIARRQHSTLQTSRRKPKLVANYDHKGLMTLAAHPRPCIENRKAMKRLGDRNVIGVDRHGWIAGQSGVGARFVDDHACRGALGFIKDAMLA